MERETKKLQTPSGKEFVLKTYLTARERNEYRSLIIENVSLDAGGQPETKSISGPLLEKSERKILELTLVSFDGDTNAFIEKLLDGTPEDYDFVVAEANKVGNFNPAK